MVNIEYVTGDATNPQGDGLKIIAHIVNSSGGWGAGFVVPLGAKYPYAESSYRQWHKGVTQGSLLNEFPEFDLGSTQFITVESSVIVANMCAQDGYQSKTVPVPLSYAALCICLVDVFIQASKLNASVHMPRIGCGLGGGNWVKVLECLDAANVSASVAVQQYNAPKVTVYDL